jgi:hypothetical protein
MKPKEYVKDINAEKKYYLDDLRPAANLKKGSVDRTGAGKNKTAPNALDNYVVDLQTDLTNLGIAGCIGILKEGDTLVSDGIFGYKTNRCVIAFQIISDGLLMREVNGKLSHVEKTLESGADAIVGPKTKKEIKLWKEKGYRNPWDIFYLVPLFQQTESDCMEICIQMVLRYNKIDATREEIAQHMGDIAILQRGPTLDEQATGAKTWGFGIKAGGNYTFDQWKGMLKEHGPLIVQWGWKEWDDFEKGKDDGAQHAVIVTGLSKEYGGEEDNYVLQNNPWGQYEEFSFKDFRGLIEQGYEQGYASIYYYKGSASSDTSTDSA